MRIYSFVQKSIGSSALPGKMLLVRIIENNKIDAYFRSELESFEGARNGKTHPKLIFNNLRTSILPLSGPDPK